MRENPQPPDVLNDARTGLNLVFMVARVWGLSVEVFLHRDMGIRYPGLTGLGVLLLVPLYGCFWGSHDLRPLCLFLIYFVLFCGMHRYVAEQDRRRGKASGHSYYNGFWVLCRFFARLPEVTAKRFVEPVLLGMVEMILAI